MLLILSLSYREENPPIFPHNRIGNGLGLFVCLFVYFSIRCTLFSMT